MTGGSRASCPADPRAPGRTTCAHSTAETPPPGSSHSASPSLRVPVRSIRSDATRVARCARGSAERESESSKLSASWRTKYRACRGPAAGRRSGRSGSCSSWRSVRSWTSLSGSWRSFRPIHGVGSRLSFHRGPPRDAAPWQRRRKGASDVPSTRGAENHAIGRVSRFARVAGR